MTIRSYAAAVMIFGFAAQAETQTLEGSTESIQNQWLYAKGIGLEFFETETEVRAAIESGLIVALWENPDLTFVDVWHEYVLPTTKAFYDLGTVGDGKIGPSLPLLSLFQKARSLFATIYPRIGIGATNQSTASNNLALRQIHRLDVGESGRMGKRRNVGVAKRGSKSFR